MKSTDKTIEAIKGQAIIKARENKANYIIHRCAKGHSFKLQAIAPEIKYVMLLEYKKGDIIIKDSDGNKLETVSTTHDKYVKKSGKGKKSSSNKATQKLSDVAGGKVFHDARNKGSEVHTEVEEGKATDVQSDEIDKGI